MFRTHRLMNVTFESMREVVCALALTDFVEKHCQNAYEEDKDNSVQWILFYIA